MPPSCTPASAGSRRAIPRSYGRDTRRAARFPTATWRSCAISTSSRRKTSRSPAFRTRSKARRPAGPARSRCSIERRHGAAATARPCRDIPFLSGGSDMKRILITGAAGQIGTALRRGLRGSYPLIRLLDVMPLGSPETGEELVSADICDMPAIEQAMAGIDCVVHLAGASVESPWDKVMPLNIEGCYNVFEAARRHGVKRVVFASSNHAVGFHRRERFIDNTVVPRPDTRYGVSKVFGEA